MEKKDKYKQYVIARKDLKLSPGKLAAQVSHATMAFLTNVIREVATKEEPGYKAILNLDTGLYENWIDDEFTKCVLQAKNRGQLLKAKTMAEELGMVEGRDFFLIKDNCHTELEPEEVGEDGVGRTLTCIGFMPMPDSRIKPITRKYHLYVDSNIKES